MLLIVKQATAEAIESMSSTMASFDHLTERDLKHMIINDGDVYMVHGGKIMSPEVVDRLRDDAIVHVVNKMPGGGNKKSSKENKPDWSERNRQELLRGGCDFEILESDSRTGRRGWHENLIKRVMELEDEDTEDTNRKLKSSIQAPAGTDPEPALEGLRRLLHERLQRK